MPVVGDQERRPTAEGHKDVFRVMEMFHILTVVMPLYNITNVHHTVLYGVYKMYRVCT